MLFYVSLETGLQTTQFTSKEISCLWTLIGLTYVCASCALTPSFLPERWWCHWLCATALTAAPPAWPGIQHTLLNHHRKQVMYVLLIASISCSEHFCETTCAQVCKYGPQIKCKEASPSEDLAFERGKVSIYIVPSPSTIKRETMMTGRVHHFLSKRLITAVSSSHSPRFCSFSVHALSAAQNMRLTCTF